jgi:hypothetical protein
MLEGEVTEAMLDAGLDELEGCLAWPHSWDGARDRIKAAYLAMDRLRGMPEPPADQPEVYVIQLSP